MWYSVVSRKYLLKSPVCLCVLCTQLRVLLQEALIPDLYNRSQTRTWNLIFVFICYHIFWILKEFQKSWVFGNQSMTNEEMSMLNSVNRGHQEENMLAAMPSWRPMEAMGNVDGDNKGQCGQRSPRRIVTLHSVLCRRGCDGSLKLYCLDFFFQVGSSWIDAWCCPIGTINI